MRSLLTTVLVGLSMVARGDTTTPLSASSQSAPSAPAAPATPTLPPGLLGQVVSGGYVVFFRHAARNTAVMSTEDLAIADNSVVCAPGSELTPEGAADAMAIGAAFTRYGVKIDRVYSSPTCRTDQMATLAFGGHEMRRELTWPGMWTDEEKLTLTPKLRELLGTTPAGKTNLVLISHNSVLVADRIGFTVELNQADAAVFRPLGNGTFEFLGTIPKSEWLR